MLSVNLHKILQGIATIKTAAELTICFQLTYIKYYRALLQLKCHLFYLKNYCRTYYKLSVNLHIILHSIATIKMSLILLEKLLQNVLYAFS